MLKKTLAMLLVVLMVVSIMTSCGKGSSTGNTPGGNDTDVTDDGNNGNGGNETDDPEPTPQKESLVKGWKVTVNGNGWTKEVPVAYADECQTLPDPATITNKKLRVMTRDAFDSKIDQNIIDQMTRIYGMEIEHIVSTGFGIFPELSASVASGLVPDLVRVEPWAGDNIIMGAAEDLLQPLSDYADMNDAAFKYNDTLRLASAWGRTFAVPNAAIPHFILWNKDMFRNNNVKTPDEYLAEGKWTQETVMEIAEKFHKDTNNDGVIDQFAGKAFGPGLIGEIPELFKRNDDGTLINNSMEQWGLDFLNYQREYNKKYDHSNINFIEDFYKGNIAMMPASMHGPMAIDFRFEHPEVPFEYGIIQLPKIEGTDFEFGKMQDPIGWAIPSGAENPELAAAVLTLTSMLNQTYEYSFNLFASIPLIWTEEELAQIVDIARRGTIFNSYHNIQIDVRDLLYDAAESRMDVSLTTALEEVKSQVDASIEEYNKRVLEGARAMGYMD